MATIYWTPTMWQALNSFAYIISNPTAVPWDRVLAFLHRSEKQQPRVLREQHTRRWNSNSRLAVLAERSMLSLVCLPVDWFVQYIVDNSAMLSFLWELCPQAGGKSWTRVTGSPLSGTTVFLSEVLMVNTHDGRNVDLDVLSKSLNSIIFE